MHKFEGWETVLNSFPSKKKRKKNNPAAGAVKSWDTYEMTVKKTIKY